MNEIDIADVNYIKSKLEMIRDHLFDDHIEIALYNVGYLNCFIDGLLPDEEDNA